jgi:ParB-like chromosome segregation protein Spo0J
VSQPDSTPPQGPEHEPESEASRAQLTSLDVSFIRVLEDLIDALLANGTLRLTDLPAEALEKLQHRKQVRQRLRNALDLIDDQDELI